MVYFLRGVYCVLLLAFVAFSVAGVGILMRWVRDSYQASKYRELMRLQRIAAKPSSIPTVQPAPTAAPKGDYAIRYKNNGRVKTVYVNGKTEADAIRAFGKIDTYDTILQITKQ